jgi:hypothetical protein
MEPCTLSDYVCSHYDCAGDVELQCNEFGRFVIMVYITIKIPEF